MNEVSGAARRRRAAIALAAAVVVAFAARASVGLAVNVLPGGVQPDGRFVAEVHRGFDFYGFMAEHVIDGRGLVWRFYDGLGDKWANRAPLYPLLVAAARWTFGAASVQAVVLVQAAVGALGCLAPAALAWRWGGTTAMVVAAWIAALWPYSVVTDTGLVEHVIYAPLVVLAALTALRAGDGGRPVRAFLAGAVAGLATLARLTFAATAAFLAVACLVRPPRWTRAAVFVVGFAVVLAPWLARNHAVVGSWTLGTDGGRALFVGNHELTFRSYPERSIDDAEREIFAKFTDDDWRRLRAGNRDEVAQEAEFRSRALGQIVAHPRGAAWGGLRKAAALWSPVMNPMRNPELLPVEKFLLYGASLVALLAAAVAGAAGAPRMRADLPTLLGVAASFTLVAAAFWGQSRYLAPLHGLALAAAGAGLAAWFERRRSVS